MKPIVSIIIPVYNRLSYLPATFESVFNQTYAQWEIVAVDDGSTDASYDWLISKANFDKRISVVKNDSGIKGPSAARNLGLKYAIGEYVVFLDSDDLLEPFCLMQRVNAMQDYQYLSYSIFGQKTFSTQPSIYNLVKTEKYADRFSYLNMFLRNENPWNTISIIWRKSTIDKIGGFDEQFLVMEDPELHTRSLLINDLKFMFFTEFPADSLYRIGNIDGEKKISFYSDSILYRILYYQKFFTIIKFSQLPNYQKRLALNNWLIGIWNLFAYFLLARASDYLNETRTFLDWAKKNNALNSMQLFKAKLLIKIWSSKSLIIRISRIRGFIYVFYLKKILR